MLINSHDQWSTVSPSVFSWSMLGRGSSSAFLLPRPEKGVLWPTPCRTHPARVAVVALVLTDLVDILWQMLYRRATWRQLSSSPKTARHHTINEAELIHHGKSWNPALSAMSNYAFDAIPILKLFQNLQDTRRKPLVQHAVLLKVVFDSRWIEWKSEIHFDSESGPQPGFKIWGAQYIFRGAIFLFFLFIWNKLFY